MKLSILLFILAHKLRNASKTNELLRTRMQQRSGSVLIQTSDQRVGRLFVLSRDTIFSKAGCHMQADVKMIWKDQNTAFKAMTSSDPQAVPQALERGDLKMQGDLSVAQWFASLISALKGTNPTVRPGEKVAVIGLGKMGTGLAHNIQKNGFDLVVYNRTSAKAETFVGRGARQAQTPREASSQADIVVTSLMDDASVYQMVTDPEGILAGLKAGCIHLCTTTISPDMARQLTKIHQDHGSHFVSACVVGRPEAAQAGELITLMAGALSATNRCKSICASYSTTTLTLGEDPQLANFAKLSVNYFAVSCLELMGQLYAFGDAAGLSREFYANFFDMSFANSTLKMYARKICDKVFADNVGFELTGGLKDVKLMDTASDATSRSLVYAPIIIEKMEKAIALGYAHNDWCVFTQLSAQNH